MNKKYPCFNELDPNKTNDWNLSDKICADISTLNMEFFLISDVREFIKRLKIIMVDCSLNMAGRNAVIQEIDKLAGDKLA